MGSEPREDLPLQVHVQEIRSLSVGENARLDPRPVMQENPQSGSMSGMESRSAVGYTWTSPESPAFPKTTLMSMRF